MAAAPEQLEQEGWEPVTLTWRQFALVTLLAGLGSYILPALTRWLIVTPFQLGYLPGALITLAILYLANVPFGFLVGYSWPRRHLRVYVPLGVAVGLAQWLAATAYFVATGAGASPAWLLVYGVAPALIFTSMAIVGDLVKKGRFSLNAAVITSAISLLAAIVGLVTALL